MAYSFEDARIQRGYVYKKSGETGFFTAASLNAQSGVLHGFSTRKGGVSPAPYNSLNLGWSRPDPLENIDRNFQIFAEAGGFCHDDMLVVNYEHGGVVHKVTAEDRGRGFNEPPLPFGDGLVTNEKNVVLITSHADCGAYFLYDPVKRAVGLAHAGWKGTLLRIGQTTVSLMQKEYGSNPADIIVSTGPCILKKNFEVDMELAERFKEEFKCEDVYEHGKPNKAQLDLEAAAAIQFWEAGILPQNLTLMQACTYELEEHFFSHRRDRGETGSMAAFIALA